MHRRRCRCVLYHDSGGPCPDVCLSLRHSCVLRALLGCTTTRTVPRLTALRIARTTAATTSATTPTSAGACSGRPAPWGTKLSKGKSFANLWDKVRYWELIGDQYETTFRVRMNPFVCLVNQKAGRCIPFDCGNTILRTHCTGSPVASRRFVRTSRGTRFFTVGLRPPPLHWGEGEWRYLE